MSPNFRSHGRRKTKRQPAFKPVAEHLEVRAMLSGDTLTFDVTAQSDGNDPLAAMLEPIAGIRVAGQPIDVTASATAPSGGGMLTFSYEVLKDGAATALFTAADVNLTTFQFTPTEAGTYEVVLIVSDEIGDSVEARQTIVVDGITAAGPEVQVNTTTEGDQYGAGTNIAMDDAGNYVITWQSYNQDGNYDGVYAQRYQANGTPVGGEFRVNSTTADNQQSPTVAMTGDGRFVIVWQSYNQDGDRYGIYAQRYQANGTPVGGEFRVNSTTADNQHYPTVAMTNDGRFVIAWQSYNQDGSSYGIYAQRYNADGTRAGNEFLVNSTITYDQQDPMVAISSDGRFVIAWRSTLQDDNGYGIAAQRYNADGTREGSEFLVNSTTAYDQSNPSVAMNDDGRFVIAWQSDYQDGSNNGVYAQRYNADGTTGGGEFLVNSTTTNNQVNPSVAISDDGRFIIAWQSYVQDGSDYGIYVQQFNADGTRAGNESLVNTTTANRQEAPAVAMSDDGRFAIAWRSKNQDGSGFGVYAQQYGIAPPSVSSTIVGGVALSEKAVVLDAFDRLNLRFNEVLNSSGAGDPTNLAHWKLELNGQDISSQITQITSTVVGERTDVELQLIQPINLGDLTLTLANTVTDLAGRSLDGDGDGFDGGSYVVHFSVDAPRQLGDETRVNTATANTQSQPAIASNAAGDYVIAWSSDLQDGSGDGVYAQRYQANGTPIGGEFLVNSTTTNSQTAPTVAMSDDGRFVIAWTSYNQDGDNYGVYAQRYNADGTPAGNEFLVNSTTAIIQYNPTVAMIADGRFVIAWQGNGPGDSSGVFAQRYNADGMRVGNEFLVNSTTADDQYSPTIAMTDDGRFVIAWQSSNQDGSSFGVYAQRYNADGTKVGGEFLVNSTTQSAQYLPAVAIAEDGRFIIAWQSSDQDGDGLGIYAQRYNADGTPSGNEFRVNSTTTNSQNSPTVAITDDGRFVIAWASNHQNGGYYDVYAKRYKADGTPNGNEFLVNSTTAYTQLNPSVAMTNDGRFVIAWEGNGPDLDYSVFSQRFHFSEAGGPYVIGEGTDLTLDASFAEGNVVSYLWDLNGDNDFSDATGATPTISAAQLATLGLSARGEYPIVVGLTDDQGNFRVATTTLTITNAPPISSIDSISAVPLANQPIDIVASATDFTDPPETLTYSYEIFQEGAAAPLYTGSGVNLTTFQFTPTTGGNYQVVLTVTDQEGASAQVDETIVVDGITAAGPEFRVNTTTTGDQVAPAIATDAAGNYVIAWQGFNPDNHTNDIYAQRYHADGTTDGSEFLVNSTTANSQYNPTVAMTDDGRFVIGWTGYGPGDSSGYGIYAQRYNADGTPVGTEFLVNSTTANDQFAPAVAMNDDGRFVIAWQSYNQDGDGTGIYAQRYDADGMRVGDEFLVNSTTTNSQSVPTIAIGADGWFVIAWYGNGPGDSSGIFAQRYRDDGAKDGGEFLVNATTVNLQATPSISIGDDGRFVIAWQSFNQDGSDWGVYAQRYDSEGTPVGTEFLVNSTTDYEQFVPTIAIDADGRFVIAWQGYGPGDSDGIFAQRYQADGTKDGSELLVNSTTASSQYYPTIASGADGRFVIAWQGVNPDDNTVDIFAQQYEAASLIVSAVKSGGEEVTENGLLEFPIRSLILLFNETLATAGVVDPASASHWKLELNGWDISSQIVQITPTVVGGRTEVELQLVQPIYFGDLTLTLLDTVSDLAGRALDGDGDRVDGGDYVFHFSVDAPRQLGDETRVNTATANTQSQPAIASNAAGDYVIAWLSDLQDGSGYGIYAQRYQANGTPIGGEFLVNSTTASNQYNPAIAIGDDGRFVITWSGNGPGDSSGIFAQQYQADGTTDGGEFLVNSTTASDQLYPTIAIGADGRFVIAWRGVSSDGNTVDIFAQRYQADGTTDGGEFLVNSTTASNQYNPAIAIGGDGRFVIAWYGLGLGDNSGIFAQRYQADGTTDGGEFLVNSTTASNQSNPTVAMTDDGRFVIAWQGINPDNKSYDIYAQRYEADGTTDGGEFLVNSTTASNQYNPAIAISDGQFVIAWESLGQDGSGYGVYAQRYQADGTAIGSEFRVNSTAAQEQFNPTLAIGAEGQFVIAWQGYGPSDSYGIYAQLFRLSSEAGGPYVIDEGTDLTLDASAADGDVASYVWDLNGDNDFSDATGATPTITAAQLAALGIGGIGEYKIVVALTDAAGLFRVATTTVTINNVSPTVGVDSGGVTANEGAVAANSGVFGDIGGGAVTVTASVGTIDQNDQAGTWQWSYSATDGPDQSQTVTITATDTHGAQSFVTFELTINNLPPTIGVVSDQVTVNEGETAANSGTFGDLGDDTVTLSTSVGNVVAGAQPGTWDWSLDATDGPDQSQTVTITATDSDGAAAFITFELVVNNVAPQLTIDDDVVVDQGLTAVNGGTYADVAADVVTLSASLGAIVDNLDGTWSWSWDSTGGTPGAQVVTITADDGDGATQITFNLTVNNAAPTLLSNGDSVAAVSGTMATHGGTLIDTGGTTLSASLGTVVNHGDGTWSWSFDTRLTNLGRYDVTITAVDQEGDTTTSTFALLVTNEALQRVGGGGKGFSSLDPQNLIQVGDLVFFTAQAGKDGRELWKTDGTVAGTQLVMNIGPGSVSSNPSAFLVIDSLLYFVAYDGADYNIWRTDGATTEKAFAFPVNNVSELAFANGTFYATRYDGVSGTELYQLDAMTGDFTLVTDINPGDSSASPTNYVTVGNLLYFTANDGVHGNRLWRTDGTAAGTAIVDVDSASSYSAQYFARNGSLYFLTYTSASDYLLSKVDAAGTVTTIIDAGQGSTFLLDSGGELTFADYDYDAGNYRYWHLNDTTDQWEVAIEPTVVQPGYASTFGFFDGQIYANWYREGNYGLWKSDGTLAGTTRVTPADSNIDQTSVNPFVATSTRLHFVGNDGTYGYELYTTDGTPEGTYRLTDIQPGSASTSFYDLGQVNNHVYFRANSPDAGNDLYLLQYAPTIDIGGPYLSVNGGTIFLNAGGTTDDVDALADLTFEWDLNGDLVYDDAIGDLAELTLSGYSVGDMLNVGLRVTDKEGASSYATTTVTIVAAAELTIASNRVDVNEGQTATIGGTIANEIWLTTSFGMVTNNGDGTWSWAFDSTDGPDESQMVTITAYGYGGVATQTSFQLVVHNVAPTIAVDNDTIEINEGAMASNTGTFGDPGDDSVTLASSVGTVEKDVQTGTWTWSFDTSDGPDQSQTVTITATDSDGEAANITFSLVVNNVAPTITVDNATITVNEGALASNTGTFGDPGDDIVTLSASVGVVLKDDQTGTWTWSFDTSDGPDQSQTVTITATDSDNAVTEVTFALVVNNVAPTVAVDNDAVTVDEGQTAANSGTFGDLGDDVVTLSASVGTILWDPQAGTWTWSFETTDGPSQSQTVTITATDSDNAATAITFELVVDNVAPTLTVDAGTVITPPARTAFATGTYADPGNEQLIFSASVGEIVDNLDGAWSWSLTNAQATDSQTVTITVDDGDGGVDEVTFDLTVLPQAEAILTIGDAPATTDASGEAIALPSDLESIHEWQTFTVNVWIRYDDQYIDDLTGVSLTLGYNSEWFKLKNFTRSDGVGQLSVLNNGDSLTLTAGQLVAADVGRDAYFLVGSFQFQPNPDGGLPNNVDGAYPEPVTDLQFAMTDIELTFANTGAVPAEQTSSPTTQMQVVPYDVDDDNFITLVDLAYLIRQIGDNVNKTPAAYRFDFDRDGVVSLVDLAYFIRNVGTNSDNGNSIRLPPPPQSQPLAAPLESESISLQAEPLPLTAQSVSPLTPPEVATPTTTTSSLLEAEPIVPSASSGTFIANVDAAFGNLDSEEDTWQLSTDSETEAPVIQAISDDRDSWRPSFVPDWALQESAISDPTEDATTFLLHEKLAEESGPHFDRSFRRTKNRLGRS